MGLPSPSELTGGAFKISEVKVVSLLNCQSSTIVLLSFHFPEFIVVPSL